MPSSSHRTSGNPVEHHHLQWLYSQVRQSNRCCKIKDQERLVSTQYPGIVHVEHLPGDDNSPRFWAGVTLIIVAFVGVIVSCFAAISAVIKLVLTVVSWPFGAKRVPWKVSHAATVTALVLWSLEPSPLEQVQTALKTWRRRLYDKRDEEEYQDPRW